MKQIKIGRSKDCDIQISDSKTKVSRVHAVIEVKGTQYYIIDYSTNGTYVSGSEIQDNVSIPIYNGDVISLAGEAEVSWYDIYSLLPLPNITGSSRATEAFDPQKHRVVPPSTPPPPPRHEYDEPIKVSPVYSQPVKYASWGSRVGAYLLDAIFLMIMALVVFGGIGFAMSESYSSQEEIIGIAYIVFIIVIWLYYANLESGSSQGTWGKQMVGIKVVDVDTNSAVSFGQATGRLISRTIIGLIPLLNLLDYLAPLWSDKKQAWHDSWSSCAVIEK